MKAIVKDKLTKPQRKALKENPKKSAVVIMDIEDTIKEANRQLSGTWNYQKLDIDKILKKLKLISITIKILNKYHQ